MNIFQNRKGFTVLELIIVLALLGTLLTISLPRFSSLSRWQLDGAARKMAADLRLARGEAVSFGKVCKIQFFVYGDLYRLELAEKNQTVRLPEGISFQGLTTFPYTGDTPYVHFNALGRPSGGGTVIIRSQEGDRRYIIVAPVTGRVRVSREPPQNW